MTPPANTTSKDRVSSEVKGQWLNIFINNVLHLSLHTPSLLKVQTWVTKTWGRKEYVIQTVHKNGVLDNSEYKSRKLWNDVASEINKNLI